MRKGKDNVNYIILFLVDTNRIKCLKDVKFRLNLTATIFEMSVPIKHEIVFLPEFRSPKLELHIIYE